MDEIGGAIKLAKENGFVGAFLLGVSAVWVALSKKWAVTPAMADMQAKLATCEADIKHYKEEIERLKIENAALKRGDHA
jgi:hypothetical protein